MSQTEIIELLEKRKELTAKEIERMLSIGFRAVAECLIKLLKSDEVKRRLLTKEEVESRGKQYTGRHYCYFLKE